MKARLMLVAMAAMGVLAVAGPANATVVPWTDGFEDGLGGWVATGSFSVTGGYGDVSPHGGDLFALSPYSTTYDLSRDMGGEAQGTLTAYVAYNANGLSGAVGYVTVGDPYNSLFIGKTVNSTVVRYNINGDWVTSDITVTDGWHEVKFVASDSGISGYWDGTLLATRGDKFSFTTVALGSYWTGGRQVAFDDVSFVPEPATTALLAIGALGVILRGRRAGK